MKNYLNIFNYIIYILLLCCYLDCVIVIMIVVVVVVVGLVLGVKIGLVLGFVDWVKLGFGVRINGIILLLIFGHCILVCIYYQLLPMLSI